MCISDGELLSTWQGDSVGYLQSVGWYHSDLVEVHDGFVHVIGFGRKKFDSVLNTKSNDYYCRYIQVQGCQKQSQ